MSNSQNSQEKETLKVLKLISSSLGKSIFENKKQSPLKLGVYAVLLAVVFLGSSLSTGVTSVDGVLSKVRATSVEFQIPPSRASSFQDSSQASSQNTNTNTNTNNSAPKGVNKYTERKLAQVARVVDGDTIVLRIAEESGSSTELSSGAPEKAADIKVRLIGINTPETVDPRRKVECFGKEASAKAKSMLEGNEVYFENDPSQSELDKYGRSLGYVFLKDGLFFNKYMIEQGYAYEYTYAKSYAYQKEFKDAQKLAETEGRGLWAEDACNGGADV